MTDDRNSDGKFAIRPSGAAPLFDSQSGSEAAVVRWEKHNELSRQAIIEYASGKLKTTLSFEEAYEFVVSNPQFKASEAGKTAAAKFVREEVGLARVEGSQAGIDNRQVKIYNTYNFESRPPALEYAEDLEAAGDVKTAEQVRNQLIGDGPYEIKVEA